ncbi:hypothetical protein DKX38_011674 [Salix brachista]|uniref:1,3-beta-glucan synthase component FKS1-like domain-containing protein n=1 Tax=Salix brachista TaxID=2182728 RepID=A0A5N5LZZ5_9ROSI|nr:hypothetical protein DKX38_011674 [Salix brachista]
MHLLIWGKAANVQFMPECIYTLYFHHHCSVENEMPNYRGGDGTFLRKVRAPLYHALEKGACEMEPGNASESLLSILVFAIFLCWFSHYKLRILVKSIHDEEQAAPFSEQRSTQKSILKTRSLKCLEQLTRWRRTSHKSKVILSKVLTAKNATFSHGDNEEKGSRAPKLSSKRRLICGFPGPF